MVVGVVGALVVVAGRKAEEQASSSDDMVDCIVDQVSMVRR